MVPRVVQKIACKGLHVSLSIYLADVKTRSKVAQVFKMAELDAFSGFCFMHINSIQASAANSIQENNSYEKFGVRVYRPLRKHAHVIYCDFSRL